MATFTTDNNTKTVSISLVELRDFIIAGINAQAGASVISAPTGGEAGDGWNLMAVINGANVWIGEDGATAEPLSFTVVDSAM